MFRGFAVFIVSFVAVSAILSANISGTAQQSTEGATPVSIRIPKALVSTSIEPREIIEGTMEDSTGLWVASWYRESGTLDTENHLLISGFRDLSYFGPGVFYFLDQLQTHDSIELSGDDGKRYRYAVNEVEVFDQSTSNTQDILGSMSNPGLTILAVSDDNPVVVVVRAAPGEPFTAPTFSQPTVFEAECPTPLAGAGLPAPVLADPGTVELLTLSESGAPTRAVRKQLDQALTGFGPCLISTRETAALADGRVLALIGPSGDLPLSVLTTDGLDFETLSNSLSTYVLMFVVFTSDTGGTAVTGVPWERVLSA